MYYSDPPSKTRFSRLRVPQAQEFTKLEGHYFEVREAADDLPARPSDDGVIAHLVDHNDPRAAKATRLWQALVDHEHQMMTWLEVDAANAVQFFQDPKSAVMAAVPDFPEELFSL